MAERKQHTRPLTAKALDSALNEVYYAPGGFQGIAALHSRLPKGAASKERIRAWIAKQEVGRYMQIRPPKEVFAHFTEDRPNAIHQADLLFLPHDRPGRGQKLYKYALTLVDVASRYKAARPLTSKLADEVAKAFTAIYTGEPLTWPKLLMVDDDLEFKGACIRSCQNTASVSAAHNLATTGRRRSLIPLIVGLQNISSANRHKNS